MNIPSILEEPDLASYHAYALELESGKYYVGVSSDYKKRLEQHFNGKGSVWTKLYKPIKVLEIVEADDFTENNLTLEYMSTYGIENVRGAAYCSIKLDANVIKVLKKQISSMVRTSVQMENALEKKANKLRMTDNDREELDIKCSRCGRNNHAMEQCYAAKHINGHSILKMDDVISSTSSECDDEDVCFRCGRQGHYANTCYALKHVKGYYLKK